MKEEKKKIEENRKLLLKDLSGRLQYGVICHTEKGDGHLCSINQTIFGTEYGLNINPVKRDYFNDSDQEEIPFKPYLRPMSAMTEEEKGEINHIIHKFGNKWFEADDPEGHWNATFWEVSEISDYLNSHFLDYRGLIPAGLALESPEDIYDL